MVIVPIGGGSGAAGSCIVAKAGDRAVRVIGVQSEAAPAAYRSWRERRLVEDRMETSAEGLATRTAFELPQRMLWESLDEFVLVSEDEIREAQALMIEITRNLVEAAGASPLAAALKLREQLEGKRVALILSGGNATRGAASRRPERALASPCFPASARRAFTDARRGRRIDALLSRREEPRVKSESLRVVIAGGGVAALEATLALRALAEDRISIELIAPEPDFVYRPLSVGDPFLVGETRRFPLAPLVDSAGGVLRAGRVTGVDPGERFVETEDGEHVPMTRCSWRSARAGARRCRTR